MWRIRAGLDGLKPYTIDEAFMPIRLDANERPEDLPPRVRDELAVRLAALPANRYPEIGQRRLRQVLAADLGLKVENIAVGNGSSEVLAALCHVFGGAGRKIVFPAPSFSMYPIYCKLADSVPAPVGLDAAFALPPAAVLDAARHEQAGLVILCNPNNPTGTVMPLAAVEEVAAGAACPVVVDEAYCEFYGESAMGLLGRYPNLVIVRTFSKAYGLAAARVGYAAGGPELMSLVNKVMLPYHVNAFSLAAAEVAIALKNEFAPGIARIVAERERLAAALAAVPGVTVVPSRTNFLLLRADGAGDLAGRLAAGGIGVRDFSAAPGLEGCLRVTVGTATENDAFLAAVNEFYTRR